MKILHAAAILAAVNPAQRDRSVYFVADGQGGHVFALNLLEHQRNVARWREIQKQKQEAQGAAPQPAVPPAVAPKP